MPLPKDLNTELLDAFESTDTLSSSRSILADDGRVLIVDSAEPSPEVTSVDCGWEGEVIWLGADGDAPGLDGSIIALLISASVTPLFSAPFSDDDGRLSEGLVSG